MAYFSHSRTLYGTSEEEKVYDFIKKHFSGNIICPNRNLGDLTEKTGYAKIASNAYYMFVWSESNHAEITRGCFEELEAFMTSFSAVKAILIEVNGNSIDLRDIVSIHKYDKPNFYEYAWAESVHLSTSLLNE